MKMKVAIIAENPDSDETKRLGSFSDSESEHGSNTVPENSSNKALYVTKDSGPGSKETSWFTVNVSKNLFRDKSFSKKLRNFFFLRVGISS